MTDTEHDPPAESGFKPDQAKNAPLIREVYFPTFVFYRDLPDADALNTSLVAAIRAECAADQVGIARSNAPRLGGWHSKNNLHSNPDFSLITEQIQHFSTEIASSLGYDPACPLRIDNMWSIINPPGSYNRTHIHPNSLWSGVYYIQVPESAGRISFVDPRTQQLIQQPRFDAAQERTADTWEEVYFEPIPGRLILFPSWLYHSVEANLTKETGEASDRIIISFNLYQAV